MANTLRRTANCTPADGGQEGGVRYLANGEHHTEVADGERRRRTVFAVVREAGGTAYPWGEGRPRAGAGLTPEQGRGPDQTWWSGQRSSGLPGGRQAVARCCFKSELDLDPDLTGWSGQRGSGLPGGRQAVAQCCFESELDLGPDLTEWSGQRSCLGSELDQGAAGPGWGPGSSCHRDLTPPWSQGCRH